MDMDRFNKRLTMMNTILTELNLQHLAEPFRTQKVGLEDVELLTDDDFYYLGVLRIKDKCRLKRRCHEVLTGKPRLDIEDEKTYQELKRILGQLNTVELSDRLRDECIAFEDIIHLSENDLETIGVEEESERNRILRERERLLSEIDNAEIQEQDDDSDQIFGENAYTKLMSELDYAEMQEQEGNCDKSFPENADTKFAGQDPQMFVELGDNAKFEKGDRNNDIKCNQNITAETIGCIGNDPRKTSCSSPGEKTTVKMGENSVYKSTRENNKIERNENYTADHIEAINGNEAEAAADGVTVEIGANSQFEMNDLNNTIKSRESRNTNIKVGDNVVFNGGLGKEAISSCNKLFECSPNVNYSTPSPIPIRRSNMLRPVDLKPITFHHKCGGNISLRSKQTTAIRIRDPSNTYVFTSRHMYPGEQINLQITTGRVNDGLIFGVTVCDPEHINFKELPDDNEFLLDRREYWLTKKLLYGTAQTKVKVCVRVTHEGDVRCSINDQKDKWLFNVDTTVGLWAYFMVKHNRSIEIINPGSEDKESEIRKTYVSTEAKPLEIKKTDVSTDAKTVFSTAVGIGATVLAAPFIGAGVGAVLGVTAAATVYSALTEKKEK